MYLFPLVMRELRTAPRRVSTWRIRFIVALISSAMILMFAGVGTIGLAGRNAGAGIFWFMAGSLFFLCLVEGWRNSADCISEEKREGTLGLLLLTDLSPLDVILGKLAAFAMNNISMILAAVPGITLAVVLGGVTFGEVVRVALACLVALSVSMSVGVFVSSTESIERRALLKAGVMLGALLVVPTVFLPAVNAASLEFVGWVSVINPIGAISSADDFDYSRRPDAFWIPFIGCITFSLVLVMAASRLLKSRWNVEPDPEQRVRVETRKRRFKWLFRCPSRSLLEQALSAAPEKWLYMRTAFGEFRFSAIFGMTALLWAGWVFLMLLSDGVVIPFSPVLLIVGPLTVFSVVKRSVRTFAYLRSAGMLEALVTTPLDLQQVVANQKSLIGGYFKQVVGAIFLFDLIAAGVAVTTQDSVGGAVFPFLIVSDFVLLAAMLIACGAASKLAIWTAITERKEGRAIMKTLLWTVGPILISPVASCCGIIGALVVILHIGSWADKMLKTDLREVIVDRLNVAAHESAFLPYGYLKSKPMKPPRVRRGGASTMGT